MPGYKSPDSDSTRLRYMDKIITTANAGCCNADASNQRYILRNHGACCYYDHGEQVDDGDENPEFVE